MYESVMWGSVHEHIAGGSYFVLYIKIEWYIGKNILSQTVIYVSSWFRNECITSTKPMKDIVCMLLMWISLTLMLFYLVFLCASLNRQTSLFPHTLFLPLNVNMNLWGLWQQVFVLFSSFIGMNIVLSEFLLFLWISITLTVVKTIRIWNN